MTLRLDRWVLQVAAVLRWTGVEALSLRQARRMSVREFAAHLGLSASSVANWERRGNRIRLRMETQTILDADLRMASDEVRSRFWAACGNLGRTTMVQQSRVSEPDLGRDDNLVARATEVVVRGDVSHLAGSRFTFSVSPPARAVVPARIGSADVDRIVAATVLFRDWDNRWGGGLSRAAVLAQLQWLAEVANTVVCSSLAVNRQLLTALADLASVAAFLCYDVEEHASARTLWLLGLDAGKEADNADVVSSTLLQLAHQALHLDRPTDALELVRLARSSTVGSPHRGATELALAEIAAYEGWSHASLGAVQACHLALGRAEDHFGNASKAEVPPWLEHFDQVELTALRGHAYHVLAEAEPAVAEHAVTLLNEAVKGRRGEYSRSRTLNLIALSATHFRSGRSEEAIAAGAQALDGAESLASPRAVERLRRLRPVVRRYARDRNVRTFVERLDRAVAHA